MSNLLNYVCILQVYFSYDTIKKRKLHPESYFESYDFTKLIPHKKLDNDVPMVESDYMIYSSWDLKNPSQSNNFQLFTKFKDSVSYY